MVLIWQEPPYKVGLPQGDIDYDTPLYRDTDGRIEDEDVDYYSSITIFPSRCTSHTPLPTAQGSKRTYFQRPCLKLRVTVSSRRDATSMACLLERSNALDIT